MLAGVHEIIRYRELLGNLIRRDLKRRYQGSILGFLWYLVNPLLIMAILSVVFSVFFREEGYPVYLLSALVAWNLFHQSILNSSTNLATSGNLIRKVYVPKAVFPLASVGGSLTNFFLSLIPLFLLALYFARPMGWSLLFVPLGVALLVIFSTGVALLISSLNVFYRDVHHIAEVLLLAWFYATPVIWPPALAQENAPWMVYVIVVNPMASIIECIRAPIHWGVPPSPEAVRWACACAFGVLVIGGLVFRRLEARFIYHL